MMRYAQLYPALTYVMVMVLVLLPVRFLHMDNMVLMINTTMVFYWVLYRPNHMPYWFIFLIGFLYDVVAGVPLGLHALTNMLVRKWIYSVRGKYIKAPFASVWLEFVVVISLVVGIHWLIMSMTQHYLFHLGVIFTQWFLTALSYPVFHHILHKVYVRMPRELVERKIL